MTVYDGDPPEPVTVTDDIDRVELAIPTTQSDASSVMSFSDVNETLENVYVVSELVLVDDQP